MINSLWKRIMNKTTSPDPSASTQAVDSADQLLYRVGRFFGRYLSLTDEQALILAVWTLHTHCYWTARTTPYLYICSTEKQSGKTLCLELLNLVCADSWLATGVTPAALAKKIIQSRPTVLLDECQTIFGGSDRQVRGLLVSGSKSSGIYEGPAAVNVFCPKAFAGVRILPPAIDERSIPIILHPAKPDDRNQRFVPAQALKEAESLVAAMRQWVDQHQPDLYKIQPYTREQFPQELTPRQQDLVEPLLQIADRIPGKIPGQIRYCLLTVFQRDTSHGCFTQLLADIRDIFNNNTLDRIPSEDVLLSLNALKTRPWRTWSNGGPMNAKNLASILAPHGITSRNVRISTEVYKGYRKRDFSPLWNHHLPEKPAAVQP
jgi:uncharacterized protein DUF3631